MHAPTSEADEIRHLTVDEARALPGLLGQVAGAHLSVGRGWYSYRADGRKILVIRKEARNG